MVKFQFSVPFLGKKSDEKKTKENLDNIQKFKLFETRAIKMQTELETKLNGFLDHWAAFKQKADSIEEGKLYSESLEKLNELKDAAKKLIESDSESVSVKDLLQQDYELNRKLALVVARQSKTADTYKVLNIMQEKYGIDLLSEKSFEYCADKEIETDMSDFIKKIEELISLCNWVSNQPKIFNVIDKKIREIKSLVNFIDQNVIRRKILAKIRNKLKVARNITGISIKEAGNLENKLKTEIDAALNK